MRKLILTLALLASTASLACDRSRAETMKRLAEMQEISAQKDSLLKDVTATTAFIAELGRQVATVRNLKSAYGTGGPSDLEDNLTPDQRRTRVLEQVREISERVTMAENRLAASRRRVTELTGSDAEKSARLAAFDSTIVSFKDIIENQKTQLAQFTDQINALTAENTQLKADNAMLVTEKTTVTTQRDSLQVDRNTVYYVIADRESLINNHVIEKSGGFLGLGTTPVPARDLDKKAFIPIDRTTVTEITLPKSDKSYRIVSRQDLTALETPPDKNGELKGTVKIKDHETFWAGSKFLIIVER
jgi:DNA repair exonuclease SbcCD ATPase subunit